MKLFLTFLFTLVCVASFAQTPLTGLYKGVGGESYLSIKEKKGKIEGTIYEKGKEPLSITGKVKGSEITGIIKLNVLTERQLTVRQKADTLALIIAVPTDSSHISVVLSFVKTTDNPKINPDKLFGTDSQHPAELVGSWVHMDFETKTEVGYKFFKNGIFEFIGRTLPASARAVNFNLEWYVKNGDLWFKMEIPGWSQNSPDKVIGFKLENNVLTLDFEYRGKPEILYRKEDKKK